MEVFNNGVRIKFFVLNKKLLVIILLGLFLFCLPFSSMCQNEARFSDPYLKIDNDRLYISYKILNSRPDDRFSIRIEVTGSNGNVIKPYSLVGDIGEGINGSGNKIIIWNLNADEISNIEGVYIQIVGEKLNNLESTIPIKSISRMGAVVRSVAFPGWGLSKIHPGKPHWIKGIAGYGCLAGSLIYNQKSSESYQSYLDSYDIEERETYYNKSENEQTISTVLGFTALGIWLTDIVWTIADSGDLSRKKGLSQDKGFSFGPDYMQHINAPMLSFRYKF